MRLGGAAGGGGEGGYPESLDDSDVLLQRLFFIGLLVYFSRL